jgi:hypothetical protein
MRSNMLSHLFFGLIAVMGGNAACAGFAHAQNREPDVFEMRRRCQSAAERLSEPMLKAMQVGKIQYRVEVKSNYNPETKKCFGLIDSANMSFASTEVQYHYSYLYNAYSGDILASITQSKNNTIAVVNDEHYDGPRKGLEETRAYINQMMTIKQ